MFIDCHAHLYYPEATKESLDSLISSAKSSKVDYIVGNIVRPELYHFYTIQQEYQNIINVLGIFSTQNDEQTKTSLSLLEQQIEEHIPDGIGELALWPIQDSISLRNQVNLIKKQIHLAQEYNLPVVTCISYGSGKDMLEIFKEEHVEELGAQIHCCRNSKYILKEFLDMGFYISFGGPPSVQSLDPFTDERILDLINYVPIEQLLTETDAPAGKTGDPPKSRLTPADTAQIAEKCASIKNMDLDDFAACVMKNAKNLFKF